MSSFNFSDEVEGHLVNWYYHERIIMGTTLDGSFVKTTALALVKTQVGLIIACSQGKNWLCKYDDEVNFRAMGYKRVDT